MVIVVLLVSFHDGDLLFFTVNIGDGGHVQDAVGIDHESDIDLGDTCSSRVNTTKSKLAEQVVVLGGLFLALVNIEIKLEIVFIRDAVDLVLLDGNGRVTVDKFGHDTVDGLDTKGHRGDIEEQEHLHVIGALTAEDCSLDSGTQRVGLIRIDILAEGFAVEEFCQHLLNLRNTGRAADEDNLVDLVFRDLGVIDHDLD